VTNEVAGRPFRLGGWYVKIKGWNLDSPDEGSGMGIYDRDYYREDTRWSNPFARSKGTIFLVLLYAFTFIAQAANQVEAIDNRQAPENTLNKTMQLDVKSTLDGQAWRIGSYALIHQSNIFHVVFTCLFLIWIGHQVEDLYGTTEYLCFFVFTSLLSGIAYTAVGAFAQDTPPLLGPSGAVTAVLILFALHYPSWRMFFFPIWIVVAVYAFIDIAGMASGQANPAKVAVHLAGAGFAFLYHSYTLRVTNWLPGSRASSSSSRRTSHPRLRVRQPALEPEPATANTASVVSPRSLSPDLVVNEHLEAKLDEVLEKVQKHGKDSLTEGERGILLKASEIYKKRRQSN